MDTSLSASEKRIECCRFSQTSRSGSDFIRRVLTLYTTSREHSHVKYGVATSTSIRVSVLGGVTFLCTNTGWEYQDSSNVQWSVSSFPQRTRTRPLGRGLARLTCDHGSRLNLISYHCQSGRRATQVFATFPTPRTGWGMPQYSTGHSGLCCRSMVQGFPC